MIGPAAARLGVPDHKECLSGAREAAPGHGTGLLEMTPVFGNGLRYTVYAAAAVLGLLAYVWLEPDSSVAPATRHSQGAVTLPASRAADEGIAAEPRRDLFFAGRAVQGSGAEDGPESSAASLPEAMPQSTDPFAGLRVMGFVRNGLSVTVLVSMGAALETVGIGEAFGAGGVLSVSEAEGRTVKVVDAETMASRTFTLSEE
jgi:hypothetical protein